MTPPRELAYYYPNPYWRDADWVKNLLLFFDGVAILVPEYMRSRVLDSDPAIISGLTENGLLTILEPESFIDQKTTEALTEAMTNILVSGALDGLRDEDTRFEELSRSRMGFMADAGLAEMILNELKERGLAKETRDGVSVPLHPLVRSLILVLLAQLLRPTGREHGMELWPATDRLDIQEALSELLTLPQMPSAGRVVTFDLDAVGIDMSSVPLDEVLDFREEHADEYQLYAKDLRRFVQEVQSLDEDARDQAILERQEEMANRANQLRKRAQRSFARGGAFALGLAGAAWRVSAGDLVGGLLSFGSNVLSAGAGTEPDAGAFSYIFAAGDRFPRMRR